MDIHQAAKALVEQIGKTGKLPQLEVGVCQLLSIEGANSAYGEVYELTCPKEFGSNYRPYMQGLASKGEWNEDRMTFLALLAETSAEDFAAPTLLSELKDLRKYGSSLESAGICFAVRKLDGVNHILHALFSEWPEFTGRTAYPVPHPSKTPQNAFMEVFDLWEGEYGEARKRLLDHCIAELEKESTTL